MTIRTALSADPGQQPLGRRIAQMILGAALAFAGIGHLTFARVDFQGQVPGWFPVDADIVVLVSGVVEIVLGAALLLSRRKRVPVGWVAAAFFIAVFPGNIAQYLDHVDAFGLDSDANRLVRLFFQPLLVLWALWSTQAWQSVRRQRRGRLEGTA
jgi:uncharacterized membrane protein